MKLRVSMNGESHLLDLATCPASVEEVKPGTYSVLLKGRSYQVNVAPHPADSNPGVFEVWVGLNRYFISLADARDRTSKARKAGAAGPVEIRAQMPGKIIKLLALEGAAVIAGQGLVVVEAMKMQNEVRAPKDGILTRIHVAEGATVGAGELLLTVE